MSEQTEQEMEVVECLEDIPAFATEDEEHCYWATHTLSQALLNQIGPVDDGFLPLLALAPGRYLSASAMTLSSERKCSQQGGISVTRPCSKSLSSSDYMKRRSARVYARL
jgi:hypothetical protein